VRTVVVRRSPERHADDVALQEAAEDLAGVSDAMHSPGVSVDAVLAELAATPIGVHDT